MFHDVIASARDWALILLALQTMLLCALPLYVLLKCVQGLRRFLPRVAPGLRSAHSFVRRVSAGIDRALASIRAPFLWLLSVHARIQGTGRAWKRS